MRYRAYADGNLFFDTEAQDNEKYCLVSATLSLAVNSGGSFTFSFSEGFAYTNFTKLKTQIDIYRNDSILWSGRVYSIETDLYNSTTITAEGCVAFLNDSVIAPWEFNDTVANLVSQLLTKHNALVSDAQKVYVGSITISSKDDVIYRNFENYETAKSRISDLVDSYGGYLTVIKNTTNDRYELSWADAATSASQSINFGYNLLDISQETNADDLMSIILPLGAEITAEDGTKARLTIASVNDGSLVLEHATAITNYGRIMKVVQWDDVTVASNLKTKAQAYLNSAVQSKITINVSAVDLADLTEISHITTEDDYEITTEDSIILVTEEDAVEHFTCGQSIQVVSAFHNLNSSFVCESQTLNLLNPASNRLTLGKSELGYVQTERNKAKKTENTVENINSDYVTNQKVESVKTDVSGLKTRVNTAENDIDNLQNDLDAAEATIVSQSSLISQQGDSISTMAQTVSQQGNRISSVESKVEQNSESIGAYFGSDGKISTWFQFDANSFTIGKSSSPIKSVQDNQSYKYVDQQGNVYLLISTDGVEMESAKVTAQVEYMSGTTGQWATRKGSYVSAKGGYNLNDVWIGG